MSEAPVIKVLPAEVVNRIAAGEVIERPASVVKELVENSLDAGATRVEIDVRDGGKTLIRVSDDGEGMSAADLEVVFLPHSTSKLTDVEDLLHIGSLGFRGEALASIGAVARARVVSRRRGETGAHEVGNEFGDISPVRPAAGREGTAVEVADLFRNVPARAKFLKSTGAEMARITEAVHRFGISTPEAEVKLTHGGRAVARFEPGMSRRERIAKAYGRDLLEALIEIHAEGEGAVVEGYLAPPSMTRADTTRILTFLNGRHVRDRTLLHALRHAYEDLIFGARHPMAFLFLTVDPGIVDQNVHPAKLEVRFRNSGPIHSLVHRAAREALTRADLAHPVRIEPEREEGDRERRVREAVGDYLSHAGDRGAPRQAGLFKPGPPGGGRPAAGGPVGGATDFLQVRDTYIVVESEEGLTILDQHALHERVLFDRVKGRYLTGQVETQRFLRPAVVDLSPVETETILSAADALASIGVLVEPFGREGVAVQGLPAAVSGADPASLLEGVLERMAADRPAGREDLAENMLATVACRAAVKAGDRLTRRQVADLLQAAENLTHAHTCPHGRPTELKLTYASLERHFRRK